MLRPIKVCTAQSCLTKCKQSHGIIVGVIFNIRQQLHSDCIGCQRVVQVLPELCHPAPPPLSIWEPTRQEDIVCLVGDCRLKIGDAVVGRQRKQP